ncbi:MAG: tRNA pseudouridine(55) synthase TruB [Nitrosomonas sp.]|nr:tRNA pseudouridine(55) synthase TruB [Nitrosomonas sp.]MDP1951574.1 tRNA pseudouridine(55) synthase TruB [Nitrosomonas sp.]
MSHAITTKQGNIKPVKRNINGVLLLNKPYGVTSNRALQIAKRLFSASKSGHTGTLDPMATGLLPICFGEATKFTSVLLGADKTYKAILKLGYISTTGDAEGEISQSENIRPNKEKPTLVQLESILQSFVGKIMQIPPMYSALKHQGKPLYAYARKGEKIMRQPREITIHDLQIESFTGGDDLQIAVRCGAGTYIRTLAEDIGKALGYGGAYLTKLCRCAIGDFDLAKAQTLDILEDMDPINRDSYLYPVDSLLIEFPAIDLDNIAASYLLQGRAIFNNPAANDLPGGKTIRLYNHKKQFLGIGEVLAEGKIIPKRMMVSY